jgi:addiction module RelE/StbE family toxin
MKVKFYPRFIKQLNRLPLDLQEEVLTKIDLFIENPYNSSLKSHKLQGRLKEFWSFSVNYSHRILYKIKDSEAVFAEIGTHDMYK